MVDHTLRRLFSYSDWANSAVLEAALPLPAEKLDQPLDIGPTPGSLRRILLHTLAGETVWLSRWKGNIENTWPNELLKTPVDEIQRALNGLVIDREMFFRGITTTGLDTAQTYRDSKGTLFKATLRDMLLQGLIHSAHHRAQAVNAIRRVDGKAPEVDFMAHVRVPAE